MQVIQSPGEVQKLTLDHKFQRKSIGLVPTMGALHQGHFSLIEKARRSTDVVVVSIFVNPLQFNNTEDLQNYPRTLQKDLDALEKLGVDIAYTPSEDAMYTNKPVVSIDFGELAIPMEGGFRPGHFGGVGVVVAKLFHQTHPDKAYFGLKDLQQFLLIRKMSQDLSFPVEVIGMPIIREESGLAMSSRNQRLSDKGKLQAAALYQGLQLAKSQWKLKSSPEETKKTAIAFYNQQEGLTIEYFEIVDPETLQTAENHTEQVAMCVAGYVEGVRLIDNLYLRQD
ncbi:pantoate--beta-alanine ligase [Marinoscillum furvescens]|uniref:Pantothenate synthetase n=1 Tax=Marinoscillum furvescens DSM 4134 TaxID=1122208 RepID=A0A3D9LIZ8_MARFU|nr:pantoate--beta-alanine ligase [Marinoscillum furvescens]REE05845.1 pantothenate synthetase [Marinoscillum furvescens DSM 4134]